MCYVRGPSDMEYLPALDCEHRVFLEITLSRRCHGLFDNSCQLTSPSSAAVTSGRIRVSRSDTLRFVPCTYFPNKGRFLLLSECSVISRHASERGCDAVEAI